MKDKINQLIEISKGNSKFISDEGFEVLRKVLEDKLPHGEFYAVSMHESGNKMVIVMQVEVKTPFPVVATALKVCTFTMIGGEWIAEIGEDTQAQQLIGYLLDEATKPIELDTDPPRGINITDLEYVYEKKNFCDSAIEVWKDVKSGKHYEVHVDIDYKRDFADMEEFGEDID